MPLDEGRETRFRYSDRLDLLSAVTRLEVLGAKETRNAQDQREFESLTARLANADLTVERARAKINGTS